MLENFSLDLVMRDGSRSRQISKLFTTIQQLYRITVQSEEKSDTVATRYHYTFYFSSFCDIVDTRAANLLTGRSFHTLIPFTDSIRTE